MGVSHEGRHEAGLFVGTLGEGIREALPEGVEEELEVRSQGAVEKPLGVIARSAFRDAAISIFQIVMNDEIASLRSQRRHKRLFQRPVKVLRCKLSVVRCELNIWKQR